jgi:hypothetical protein
VSEPPTGEPQWVPPPPPTIDSPFEPRTLVEKTEYVNKYVYFALGLSIASLVCCGFIGFYSFGLASSVVETIDYYNICHDKRGLAVAAKYISLFGAVVWIIGLVLRYIFRLW